MNAEETQYNEDLWSHQQPVVGISEWQTYNDIDGSLSMFYEREFAEPLLTNKADP